MRASLWAGLFLFVCLTSGVSLAVQPIPKELQDVGIFEKLGQPVSLSELTFRDETGQSVRLSQYFGRGRPVLLSFVYFDCPNLCNYFLNGVVDSIKPMTWAPGEQYDMVTLSMDSKEGPALAVKKKAAYLQSLGRPGAEKGWHFLTGEESQIRKLADQVGFKFKWDVESKQWAHTSGLFVMTPDGKVSRVLHGILFKERDLKLALVEASNGQVGSIVDRILLFCFHYDPQTRGYSLTIFRIMQAGAISFVLVFGSFLALFWRRQRKGVLSPC